MNHKILVIEDEEHINELICLNLETAGYEPIPFYDGDALSLHLKESPDGCYTLALLDVMLPGKDGFVLLPHPGCGNLSQREDCPQGRNGCSLQAHGI